MENKNFEISIIEDILDFLCDIQLSFLIEFVDEFPIPMDLLNFH